MRARSISMLILGLLGFNRWIYRVITYVALMRDEFPPFRLDQGTGEVHERYPVAADANTVRPAAPPDGLLPPDNPVPPDGPTARG